MGLISWLFRENKKSAATNNQVAEITNAPGTYDLDVVGESHYQQALESICGGRTEDSQRFHVKALLVPENDNPHDSKAVCVYIEGHPIGHLSRDNAREFRNQMRRIGLEDVPASCNAIIVGGWDRGKNDRGHFGVKLDIPVD